MARALLTLNAGSSSLKVALFDVDAGPPRLVVRGEVEGFGVAPRFVTNAPDASLIERRSWAASATFETILEEVIDWAESRVGSASLAAVGHRVVHGGRDHVTPERISPALLNSLEALVPLAPLHQPHNLAPIRLIAAVRPHLPQVACFDTAFHATMPQVATRFALPQAYEDAGVRRYGFHGLSYEHISRRMAELDPRLAAGRVVVAHLGAGASLCAMSNGRSLDTSMGFTALDGLVMSTRCGSLDPGVVLYIQRNEHLSLDEVEALLYARSGLLGVSGISGDMRVLLASDDPPAREAVELFVYRAAREIASLACALGGLDGLVFTAGIGEHSPEIRAGVCDRLGWLGLALDRSANSDNAAVVSTPDSHIVVRVIPTDEEATIARHTVAAI
jgi:acetate kinase